MGKRFDTISKKTMSVLQGYPWPGNIRELENLTERAVITSFDGNLQFELPTSAHPIDPHREKDFFGEKARLKEFQRECFIDAP